MSVQFAAGSSQSIPDDYSFESLCSFHQELLTTGGLLNADSSFVAKRTTDDSEIIPFDEFLIELGEKEKERESEEDKNSLDTDQDDFPVFYMDAEHHSFQFLSNAFSKILVYNPELYPFYTQRRYLLFENFLI